MEHSKMKKEQRKNKKGANGKKLKGAGSKRGHCERSREHGPPLTEAQLYQDCQNKQVLGIILLFLRVHYDWFWWGVIYYTCLNFLVQHILAPGVYLAIIIFSLIIIKNKIILVEPPHGVLGSRENGGQNNQGAGSRVGKSLGSR